jgi:hypothetical protein
MLLNKRLLGMLLLACAVAACDDDNTPTTPTTPAPTVTTTFTGSFTQNGAVIHTVAVSAGGPVTGTLKTLADDNTLPVGFALGSWNGTTCTLVVANESATEGAVLTGSMTAAGTMCARVADSGKVPAGTIVKYTIEIVHP